MGIRQIYNILKRWIWLLILAFILGAAGGYFFSNRQPSMYQARTRFIVLRAVQTTYDYYAYLDSQQLISTYTQLLSTGKLIDAASEQLGYRIDSLQATAEQIEDTQFVQLTVTDQDPQRAAEIANVLVSVLIEQNDLLQSIRYETAEKNLQNRIDDSQQQIALLEAEINTLSLSTVEEQLEEVQSQIETLQKQIADLDATILELDVPEATPGQLEALLGAQADKERLVPVLTSYQEIYTDLVISGEPYEGKDNTPSQLNRLQSTLALYQQIYISSISSLEALNLSRAQNAPTVVHVEPARIPSQQISPKPFQSALTSGIVALLFIAGFIFFIDYLDDTIKTPEDVKQALDLPVIGLIVEGTKSRIKGNPEPALFVANQPRAPISEAFRTLRTNLEFSSIDKPLQIVIVASAKPEEGKTTIATNLATIITHTGKKVLILDADMRRPSVHKLLNLPNNIGLSDLIRGKLTLDQVIQNIDHIENLDIITSGNLPPNPAELLASNRLKNLFQEFRKKYDFIVLDTPPLIVTDTQVLSQQVDGLIYVIQSGKTRINEAKAPITELRRLDSKILGVVINRMPKRFDIYGGYYYSPYFDNNTYDISEVSSNDQE